MHPIKLLIASLLIAGPALAQDQTLYCPNSTTDTDGDGWGFENGLSCIVVDALDGTPMCSAAAEDSDGDGWGWEGGQSCVIDNQFASVAVDGGVIMTPQNGSAPIVSRLRSKPLEYLRSAQTASDGTVYTHMPALNLLTALDQSGNAVWQVQIPNNNFVNQIRLDDSETTLYLIMAAGEIASYSVDGSFNWMTSSFGTVWEYVVTESSIVLRSSGPLGQNFDNNSFASLALDGSTNWKFTPQARFTGGINIDADGNVVIRADIQDGSEIITIAN